MLPIIPVHNIVPVVPFYSQFKDIQPLAWQKIGCGVASLAMIIEYYKPKTVSVNKLLNQAVLSGAYKKNTGWIHKDLILLSKKYGLDGNAYELSKLTNEDAFTQFKKSLQDGPVIVSIHYKFNPKSPIPHLVVIDGIKDGVIYYNDPAEKNGGKQISTDLFLKGWKKKFIVVRPVIQNINEDTDQLSVLYNDTILTQFKKSLKDNPTLVSNHYKSNFGSTMPYLKVIDDVKNGVIY